VEMFFDLEDRKITQGLLPKTPPTEANCCSAE
jgi:hypothetical protein